MKMKLLNRLFVLVFLLGVGFACTDLEEELTADFSEGFTPQNPGFGESANTNMALPADGLNAAYNALGIGTANHFGYFSAAGLPSDEITIAQKGGDWFDGGVLINLHVHDFRSTNPILNNTWAGLYGGIFQCNDVLASGLNAQQTAEVRAVRAVLYWKLMDMWGNIKLLTTPGADVPQGTRAEAFAFIESEALAAIPDLPVARTYGRFNQSVAYALLARLYLNAPVYLDGTTTNPTTGNSFYQDAIDAADAVINSGLYDLDANFYEGADGRMISAVYAPDNVNNIEHIYAFPYDEATGGGMNFAQMTLHYPSQLTYDLQQQPWNGYASLEEFYNSYAAGDKRKEAYFITGPQKDINGNPILDVAFDQNDPDGAEINYTPAINELFPNSSRQAGARMGKFAFKAGQLPDMDNDYPIFRYGELLLVKAEALCRLNGDWANAEAWGLVNQVRARAGLAAEASPSESTFFAERGREVFQEALRRTDLIRFGKWGDAWWEKAAHSDAYKNLMPIPNDQINASGGTLSQNPGY